jgi:hypothetical protein
MRIIKMSWPIMVNWSSEIEKKPVAHKAEVVVNKTSIHAIGSTCIIGRLKIIVPITIASNRDAKRMMPGWH